jgi:hypothetical protein
MGGAGSANGDEEEKPEGKTPVGRPRRKWVDYVKINLRGIGWGGMNWIDLGQDKDQWMALVNTNKQSGSIKCWKVFE